MKKLVVLVTQEDLGRVDAGDRQFGVEIFDRFLHAFESQAVRLACICFYTNEVKPVCEGSAALLGLRLLRITGVKIFRTSGPISGGIQFLFPILKAVLGHEKPLNNHRPLPAGAGVRLRGALGMNCPC